MPEPKRISDRQIAALNAIAEAGHDIAAALRETQERCDECGARIDSDGDHVLADLGIEDAQIDAPVPAERPDATPGGSGTSRTLPDPKGGCVCWFESEDRGGGYSELVQEYEPACPVHSEHLYDPRTGFWVIRAEQEQDQADRAHKAVHDTLRWVEGKERDARRASDKANEQVYQQVARMLRRAFDRAGTAETGETTDA